MAELRLSRRASDEIHDEAERLGAFSPAYARSFIDAVFAKADLLRQFPELGRMVPEYGDPTIRELFHRHYRIFYFVSTSAAQVKYCGKSNRLVVLGFRGGGEPQNDYWFTYT